MARNGGFVRTCQEVSAPQQFCTKYWQGTTGHFWKWKFGLLSSMDDCRVELSPSDSKAVELNFFGYSSTAQHLCALPDHGGAVRISLTKVVKIPWITNIQASVWIIACRSFCGATETKIVRDAQGNLFFVWWMPWLERVLPVNYKRSRVDLLWVETALPYMACVDSANILHHG